MLFRSNLYIFLEGEIDQSVAGELRVKLDDYLNSVRVKNVILNMKELTFMDSTGVGLLIGRYKKISALHKPVYISGASPAADRVLTLAGIYSIMPKI